MPDRHATGRAVEIMAFGHVETSFSNSGVHGAVLQTLNRWRVYEGKKYYYAANNFVGTEPTWDNVPVVYAQEHPDLELVDTDLETALKKVKGVVAGRLIGTQTVVEGQPRLEAQIELTDPRLESDYKTGKLSLSTAFTCQINNDGRLIGKVKPNHLLLFRQDDKNQPGDPGAMFLHKRKMDGDEMTKQADFVNIGRKISTTRENKFKALLEGLHGLFNEMISGGVPDNIPENPGEHAPEPPEMPSPGNAKLGNKDCKEQSNGCKGQKNCSDKMTNAKRGGGPEPQCNKPYPWDQCVQDQLDKGYSQETADKICGAIRAGHKNKAAKNEFTNTGAKNMTEIDVDDLNTELEAQKVVITNMESEIKELETEKAGLASELDIFKAAAKDSAWNDIKNKLPKGMVPKDEEAETKLRAEFEDNAPAFVHKLLALKSAPDTKEEGQEFQHTENQTPAQPGRGIGVFVPGKGWQD